MTLGFTLAVSKQLRSRRARVHQLVRLVLERSRTLQQWSVLLLTEAHGIMERTEALGKEVESRATRGKLDPRRPHRSD